MKYFTKEWCFSDQNDEEIEYRATSYKEYINKIYKDLPFVLKILSKNVNFYDARINNITLFSDQDVLILNGVFCDIQSGYYFLDIQYRNTSSLNIQNLTDVFNCKKLEILSDEIELISEKNFSHRIIFTSKKEIEIAFEDVQISLRNATSNDYKNSCLKLEIL